MKTRKLTKLSMLTALSLILFIIEMRIPNLSPVQGVRLGLANIVTVYAVYEFRPHEAAMMVAVRVILGAAFSGNPSALIYSVSGAVFCLAGMILLKKVVSVKYIWLSSICGAVFHNAGQITAAMAVTRSAAVLAYFPVLVLSGCIAGLFTGLCAGFVIRRAFHEKK